MTDVPKASTESQLREWRTGQVGAERLTAALLHISDFENIDPQAPLGGPDDKKDILCELKGKTYVAAAYFPTTDKTFRAVLKKFEEDLDGPIRHNRDGIVFVTNGRAARAILIQQCIDLFGHIDPDLIDRGADYYLAIKQAGQGNNSPLIAIIRVAITV